MKRLVTIISDTHTVYSRAHVPTDVELTPRIEQLISLGVFRQVGGAPVVPAGERPANVIALPTRAELSAQATEIGIAVKPAWSPMRIKGEIDSLLGKSVGDDV